MNIKVNVGTPDQIARIVVGAGLIALAAIGTIGPWGWIGVVLVLTGGFRVCPAYTLIGISTCKTPS